MRIYLTAMLGAPNSHSGAARNPGGVKGMTAQIGGYTRPSADRR
jgi:hypothetical protein